MKVWTYLEMATKVLTDLDLMDETFIQSPELVGYFNEAIDEAEAEIITLPRCDYLKKYDYLRTITGKAQYPYPYDCYATKVRRLIYTNGSIIYPITLFKPRFEFEDVAFTDQYGQSDDYRWVPINSAPGQMRIEIHPVSRETAIAPPPYPYPDSINPQFGGTFPGLFTPVKIWYLRTLQRLPIPTANNVQGELRFTETLVGSLTGSAFSSVSVSANTVSTVCGLVHSDGYTPYVPGGNSYVLGDILYFTPEPGGTLPSPLVVGTPYYVIPGAAGVIQLATSLANAVANTPLVLTTTGAGFIDVQAVTTQAIVNSLLVDVPQFAIFVMQWVKARCLLKDGDPRLGNEDAVLEQQRKQMNDTLAEWIPDLDTEIEPDFSAYQEMS